MAGQYFDAETGLHYNYHRYYDPTTGRYLTPDPIGLAGGINIYAYVNANPINLIDPYGLTGEATAGRILLETGKGIGIGTVSVVGATVAAVIADLIVPRSAGEGSDIVPRVYVEARDGSQDPPWVADHIPYNPGRDPNNNCKPCKDSPIFKHPDQESHPCKGHQIRYRQNPVTCECFPYRHDF